MDQLNTKLMRGTVTRRGEKVFETFWRYKKTIKAAPSCKVVSIYSFNTSAEAKVKLSKLKAWPYKVITNARDEKGRFTKGVVLICCK